MCDRKPLENWLKAILATIIAAGVCVTVAAALNLSYWTAYASPGWMGLAAVTAAAAAVLCRFALDALGVFCQCVGKKCAGSCANLGNTLTGAIVVLSIEAVACALAAVSAWLPVWGAYAMYPLIGAFAFQGALIANAIWQLYALSACEAKPPSSSSSGLSSTSGTPPVSANT